MNKITAAQYKIAKANKPIFRIGHGAYGEWSNNHPAKDYFFSKASAIEELRNRGYLRREARIAIKRAMTGEWSVCGSTEIVRIRTEEIISDYEFQNRINIYAIKE